MIWVVDASVAVRWFIKEESHPHADAVLETLLSAPEKFAVPELFCFEVYTVLNRIHPRGKEVFLQGMIPVLQSGLLRYPMTGKIADGASAFIERGLTGYDACYAALAGEIKGKWLTFDDNAHQCIRESEVSHPLSGSLPADWP
jgi:predicted nucleic acid-binding protein